MTEGKVGILVTVMTEVTIVTVVTVLTVVTVDSGDFSTSCYSSDICYRSDSSDSSKIYYRSDSDSSDRSDITVVLSICSKSSGVTTLVVETIMRSYQASLFSLTRPYGPGRSYSRHVRLSVCVSQKL